MFRSWIRPLAAVAFCCFALTAWATPPDAVANAVPDAELRASNVEPAADLEAVENEVELVALFADGAQEWLRPASGGGGSCYNCNTHSDCDNFCGPSGGACLRDLDGVCTPEPLKYCWCF